MPPTTSSVTSGCALSYSAATFLKVTSSFPALQPTQTLSFVGDARCPPPAIPAAASAATAASAAATATRFIPSPPPWCELDTFTRRAYDSGRSMSIRLVHVSLIDHNGAMATPPLLKRLNEETVLDTIRSGAPISRAEIARRAGISKPTVSLALQTLLEAGLVWQAAEGPPGPSY